MAATVEYQEGVKAYILGLNDSEACPYPMSKGCNDQRVRWMSGYWGERVRQFLLRFDAKHGRAA